MLREWDDTPEGFGRVAATTARQVILQRLRDAEDEATFGAWSGREGDLVSGVIQQGPDPQMVLIDLGPLEAQLPAAEQVPGEKYVHGERLRCYVVGVRKGARGPIVTVSRTHPGLVKAPLRARGSRDRRRLGRDRRHRPRGRSPHQDRRAVAQVRARRQGRLYRPDGRAGPGGHGRAARREDRHRRLVSTDPAEFVGHALSPARVSSVTVVDADSRAARVVVPDYQLSLAIGREGQNARLAARLTGWRIDIVSDTARPVTRCDRADEGADADQRAATVQDHPDAPPAPPSDESAG